MHDMWRRSRALPGWCSPPAAATTTTPATTRPAHGTEAATGRTATEAATATERRAAGGDCVVGVSWNNYQEQRWAKWDEPALKAAIEAGGGTYISNDAKSSAETQASNLENLISQGANVLVVLAQDGTAIKPSVQSAIAQGVPVIAYDRLIEDPDALYITFDNVEGRRDGGRGGVRRGAERQLRDHQGQQGRRQRRLPPCRHARRSSAKR